MSEETDTFIALGPAGIGFRTNGARIEQGGNMAGANFGVVGSCGTGKGAEGAGVHGSTAAPNANGVIGIANNGSNAYGIWGRSSQGFAGNFDGKVRVRGSLRVEGDLTVVGGAKSAAVRDGDGTLRRLYAIESPESWFEDVGFGQLVDSQAQIELESVFASVVADGPYHVFVSEYDSSNGLYVTDRTSSGFVVRARKSGVNSEFSYRVAAKRKDIEATRFEDVDDPMADVKSAPAVPPPPEDPQ